MHEHCLDLDADKMTSIEHHLHEDPGGDYPEPSLACDYCQYVYHPDCYGDHPNVTDSNRLDVDYADPTDDMKYFCCPLCFDDYEVKGWLQDCTT